MLDDLDAPHFGLLNLMNVETPPHHGDPARLRLAVPTGWMRWDVAQADGGMAEAVWALLSGFQRRGLVSTSEFRTAEGVQEPVYAVTDYGRRFLARLSDPL